MLTLKNSQGEVILKEDDQGKVEVLNEAWKTKLKETGNIPAELKDAVERG